MKRPATGGSVYAKEAHEAESEGEEQKDVGEGVGAGLEAWRPAANLGGFSIFQIGGVR